MTKYIIGEIFSSGGATLYKNPSEQTVYRGPYRGPLGSQLFYTNQFDLPDTWMPETEVVESHLETAFGSLKNSV